MSTKIRNISKRFYDKFKLDPIRFDCLPGVTACWNPIKLVKLYCMLLRSRDDKEITHAYISSELLFERSTVTKKINATDWDDFGAKLEKMCTLSDEDYLDESAEEYRIKALAREATKQRKTEISKLAMMKHLESRIATTWKPRNRVKLPLLKLKPQKKTRTPEHMVLLLSDQHVGLEFSKDETGGLNEYNLDIYLQRMVNLRQALIDIFALHSELYKIPELHILSLGDAVQGTNMGGNWGPGYISSTASIDEQARICADSTGELLSAWSNYFKKVHFVGVVGNHGRAGLGKNSDKVQANWDNVVYSYLKRDMQKHDNVDVDYSRAWWAQRDINGTEFLLVHGDNMRSSVNSILSEEQRIQSLIGNHHNNKPFNILVAGHYHSHYEVETSNGKIILNGSFVGGDVYSMKTLRVRSKPTQTVMGVHPKYGITWKYCLDLSSSRSHN